MATVCREHQLNPQVVSHWKRKLLENAASIFEHKKQYSGDQERIAGLERVLGRKTLALDIVKKHQYHGATRQKKREVARVIIEQYPVTTF